MYLIEEEKKESISILVGAVESSHNAIYRNVIEQREIMIDKIGYFIIISTT